MEILKRTGVEDRNLKNITSGLGSISGSRYFLSSDGADIEEELFSTTLHVEVVLKDCPKRESNSSDYSGGTVFMDSLEPEEIAQNALEGARDKLPAGRAPVGRSPVMIDSELSGVLAHESFGHMSEGDFIISGLSPLRGKIGEEISLADITDSGVLSGDGTFSIHYDDEGVRTREVKILENGILNGYLHDRESAYLLNSEPTGNARAVSFEYEPIPRMRNTYFESGDYKFEEAIEEMRDGVYLVKSMGGMANMDGSFLFHADRGYIIKGGEIRECIRDVALSGNVLEILKDIRSVCNDLKLKCSAPFGGCGKGEQYPLPVSLGGPSMVIRGVKVGGR